MPVPKILVLYNRPLSPKDHPAAESEYMVVEIAEKIVKSIAELGYRTSILPLGAEPNVLWRELKRRKPDAVVNLYEGTLDDTETESYIAGLLAWSGIPYTGCPPHALTIARAKHLAKMVFKGAGLPTADFVAVNDDRMAEFRLRFPVIVKPATQDASVGIEHASVCQSQAETEARVRHTAKEFGYPVLVEEFISGRELLVAVTELPDLRTYPPGEILFRESSPGSWPILTYSSKWKRDSSDDEMWQPKFPADVTPELADELGRLAMRAFRLLNCRDYARVDFRVDEQNRPYILEVNPNPEVSDDAWVGYILKSAGVEFPDFLRRLIEATLKRGRILKPG